MKHKIHCFCDTSFTVEAPGEIDLEKEPRYIENIIAGDFMTFTCGNCGKKHKPEFPLTVYWPGKRAILEILPELERSSFYHRKDGERAEITGTIIGYPELAERIAVLRDDLVPEAVEALKYYLFVKADESYPENEISVWYQNRDEGAAAGALVFHIHGIKPDEAALSCVPFSTYEKTLDAFKNNPGAEPFGALRVKTYVSLQNMLRPDELK